MSTHDFLVELGTEELPPTALKSLAESFRDGIEQGLQSAGLSFTSIRYFASPRRLAVAVTGLDSRQADRAFEKRGPALKAPEQAVAGFARSCGVELSALEQLETDKGSYFVYRGTEQGKQTPELLPEIVSQSLHQLPIPKRMRWGASRTEFVRPAHWLVMLFGDEVVDCSLLGLKAGRKTRGHRYHYNQDIELISPDSYESQLLNTGKVIADFSKRCERIREQILAESDKLSGQVEIDEDLLEEVAALNEWPVALTGRFEERFLEVPPEALISSMKANQKYFHLLDSQGKLLPYFITVANIESRDPAQVISGNEKVIRPRLADAAFFYDKDRKTPLASRIGNLKNIIFQNELGTLFDKSERVARLAIEIAKRIDGNTDFAARAANLSKCDLMTDMVFEFTELQGLMGLYYARHDGEPEEVAQALNEQYMPRYSGDELPQTATGKALAIADRLDTLVGLFGINQPPTGSKDPFALRRQSLGILRIIIESDLNLDLQELTQIAADNYGSLPAQNEVVTRVVDFMLDRFRAWYDEKGISPEIYLAVHALRPTSPLDFDKRIRAVAQFQSLPQASALAAANKRVSNILAKQGSGAGNVAPALLTETAEQELATLVLALQTKLTPLFAVGDYEQALTLLAELEAPVNRFFDDVMVMAEDEAVRNNRIALLANLRELFLGTADISLL
ncbi:glycine--tRNA ligase subunit beta [Nitrincola sp. MINF-07-Sa-05]|uniref:glycine--tRNA ligase subunit beta n=1 Tax=Nitrincola salilacus TaxID=3400273 RepID=UPI0039180BC6